MKKVFSLRSFRFSRPALLVTLLGLPLLIGLTWFAAAELDEDGNLLSDVFELMHGDNLDPAADSDGDGHSNLQESGAGTNPLDPADVANVKLSVSPAGLHLDWPGVFGKTYEVQLCNDLTEGVWKSHGLQLYNVVSGPRDIVFNEQVPLLNMGGIRHRVWNREGVWYDNVPEIITEPPDSDTIAAAIEIPANTGEYYIDQMVGYVVPETTGPHRFFVSGDDVTELFLSPDSDPANMASICRVPEWTAYNEFDKFPEQQSAEIVLQANTPYYIELRHIEGSGGDHFRVFWQQPDQATPALLGARHLAPWQSNQEIVELADSHFFRVRITNEDDDNDGLSNWEETVLGLGVGVPNTAAEISAAMVGDDAVVSLEVLREAAYERFNGAPRQAARIRAKRSGANFPLSVNLIAGGDTTAADFDGLPSSLAFGVGVREVEFELMPNNDNQTEPLEQVTISIGPGARYVPGGVATVTCTVEDGAPEVFLANLRPERGAVTAASGHSILRLAANDTYWHVDLEFGGLTSEQTAAHIHLAPPEIIGPIIHGVDSGSFNDFPWTIVQSGQFSPVDIRNALDSGNLYINAHSQNYLTGEIRGHYKPVQGGQTIDPPPAPPAWNEGDLSDNVAARFLNQATFGATAASINEVQAQGYEGWIDNQVAMSPTTHMSYMDWIETQFPITFVYNEDGSYSETDTEHQQRHRWEAFWDRATTKPDQLRQRVAFALSEILVISSDNDYVYSAPLGATDYYDMLVTQAFGNYRDLLEDVSLHPLMGNYLSSFRNPKPDPILGVRPDENYAREVMQLFSIGLWRLHQDGSLVLDETGRPIPTYDQFDITGMAHVFTGWAYNSADPDANFWYGPRDDINSMMQYPEYHDTGEKQIIDDIVIPAGQTGEQDLDMALDVLFNHPSIGPFISRQLIQRLVTSNPSRAYIYRVAGVFADNGVGVRGDLGAVVKAILMDYEARHPTPAAAPNFGHLKEPLLRMSHLMRAFDFTVPPINSGRISIYWTGDNLHQNALRAPSVFNFFEPGYSPPGLLSEQGLVGPEFQIADETKVIQNANYFYPILFGNGLHWSSSRGTLDLSEEISIYQNSGIDALITHLDTLLCNGQISPELRSHIAQLDADLIALNNTDNTLRTRVAIRQVVNSPAFAVQK